MEKKKMKIRRFLSVFLLTLLLTGLFCVPQASAVDLPQVNAKAALLMDYESGRMLYGLNERDTEYPASITKVMTALLTLEAVDQGVLTLDQQVAAPSLVNDMDPTGSSADIKEGEVLTVEQLLYCMMLVSANEAACILAETVAGSQDAFVALMNQRAQELGCTGTHFVNPNGLHDPNHYSTAWDIYLFTREAMKNETFMKICSTASYVVPATNMSEERELYTTNSLISNWRIMGYQYDGADGIKTGSTEESGYCLVSTAKRSGRRLVSQCGIFEYEGRFMMITDAAINIAPDVDTQIGIVENALPVANALGVELPKVAVLSAVENVTEKMPSTVSAAEIAKRGIPGCVVSGPLALDGAISMESVKHKGIHDPVAGQADILLVPFIEIGNVLYKSITYIAGKTMASTICGASCPVIITSRADTPDSKYYSILLAVLRCLKA
jgi:hypothetical protein